MIIRAIQWTALSAEPPEGLALVTGDEIIRKSPLLKTMW
jgi:hypothetical protein